MTNEQIAHDLAVAVLINRGIDTPIQAYEEYLSMYKTIFHEIDTSSTK